MVRALKISISQVGQMSLAEIVRLIGVTVYTSQPIVIYQIELKELARAAVPKTHDVQIEKGTLEQLEMARRTMKPCPWEFLCDKYDGVKDFFIARQGAVIQHINWIYYKDDHNRILRLGDGDAEFKFGLTLPPYRGRGLQTRTLRTMAEYLADKGLDRAFACVRKDNAASLRGIEKAGFRLAGETRLRKVMGVQTSTRINTRNL